MAQTTGKDKGEFRENIGKTRNPPIFRRSPLESSPALPRFEVLCSSAPDKFKGLF